MPEIPPLVPGHDATSETPTRSHPLTEPATNADGSLPRAPLGYELSAEIGRGGMGVVYRARDLALNREVAVKLLLDCFVPESAPAGRFVEEAQITGQLQHPGIPPVHQTGTTPDGRPFLAMKLVKGRTLAELLADRADPVVERSRFLAIFEHVCHAVGYAHAHDVIHRDLKPSNIMVGTFDEVQVMDWGLAKVMTTGSIPAAASWAEADAELTRTAIGTRRNAEMATQAGSLLGTPAFMSPEQAGGETDKIGPPSDVFGLGAILCVILTGQPPYRGPGAEAIRLQAVRGELDDAFARLDECGAEPELVALAKRCLAKLPQRPASAAEVANAIAGLRAAAEERARRAELERAAAEVRVAEQRKRRRVWYALAAVLLLGTAASVVLTVLAHRAEGRAIAERDLKEQARAEAVANEAKTRAAEAARRLELGRTAAAAAELAAGRGRWAEATRLFETAMEFGGGDEIELKLGHFSCRAALGQVQAALTELDELAARPDLGRFAGQVLLCQAECALFRQAGGDPRELARQAIQKGLPPADAAYAKVFLCKSAPEAIKLLQEATRLDPFHSRGLDCLAMLLLLTGRRAEFREVVTQVRMSCPDSAQHLFCELFLRAMDGDRAGAERLADRLAKTDYKEAVPLFRSFADVMVIAQSEEFFFGGVPLERLMAFGNEYAKMAQYFSRMAGEKNAADAKLGGMRLFQLPMFQALAETPQVKGLTAAGLPGVFAMLKEPAKLADLFGTVAQAIPDGTFLMLHGMFLQLAGRLPEAEAAFRRAIEHPSWANHRRAAQFQLVQTQWQLATSPQTAPKEQAVWKDRALASLRDLAFSGSESLPPDALARLASVASACGDLALGLALTEAVLRKKPDDPALLDNLGVIYWRMKLYDKSIPIFERNLATRRKANGDSHLDTLRTQLNLGVNYRDAGRLKEAIPLLEQVESKIDGQPSLQWGRGELLSAYVLVGKSAEGTALVKKFLTQSRKDYPPGSIALSGALAQNGNALIQLKAWNDAEPILREVLSIREKTQPEAWNTFYARSMLGEALAGQKKYADAEPLLVQGFEGLKKRATQIPEPFPSIRLTEAAEWLVRLYEALDKKDEAAKWRKVRDGVRN